MFSINSTPGFLRTAKKFFKRHPELKSRFKTIMTLLINNPSDPALKIHPLQGDHKGLYSIKLTYKYRITLVLQLAKKEITLLDIGSHDEVY